MNQIKIEFIPYVGLIGPNDRFVKTKMKDGKLHFFEWDNNEVSCGELEFETVQSLKSGEIVGATYLGYVELLNGQK